MRTVAMAMSKPDDLLNICEVLFKELYKAGFKDMRCALIHIFNDEKEISMITIILTLQEGKLQQYRAKGIQSLNLF
ncbi:MAG: hypothetical protein IPK96_09230 [Flammeovirgaceae bacterium]|nr:hypothetical protein [Flammeovirgaceae bacterium]